MNHKISGIYYLSCGSYGKFAINFESLIHGFSHYFKITLDSPSKEKVATESFVLFRAISHE